MYNDVDIKFLPRGWERGFSTKEKDYIDSFDIVFSENKQPGFKKNKEGVYKLRIIDKSKKADVIFEHLIKMKRNIDFVINVRTKYESDDFLSASAYLLRFEKKYEYYDGWDEDKYNSFKLVCMSKGDIDFACKTWEHIGKIYAKPQSGLKKCFEGFAGATNYELSEDSIISDALFSYLVENNIDESFFRPVYQKNGKRWAYILDGSSSPLPAKTVKCNLHTGPYICPKCGRNVWRINEELNNSFNNAFENQVVLGNPNIFEYWTIDQTVIKDLKPVNITNDYFLANRLTLVNKELFEMIREKNTDITKHSIPIFQNNAGL